MANQINWQQEEKIQSVFNNHHICYTDTDTSLALHGEDREKTK